MHILAYDFDPFAPEVRFLESELAKLLKEKDDARMKYIENAGYVFSKKSLEFLKSRENVRKLDLANCLVNDGYFKDLEDEEVAEEVPAVNAENINPPESKDDDYWYYINMDMLSADFDELKAKNPDTVAFVKVNGTNVNYPVVQTNDNEYYLNRAFDGSKNSAGWVFADYRNDMVNFGYNTIIYGHSRYDKTMFGSLKNVLKESWYSNKDNHIIKLSTPTENTLWQIFSIYTIPAESYYITTDFNESSYNEFLTTIKGRSQINFSGNVNTNDKVLTLSTCNNDAGTERLVIHAKLIKKEAR